MFYYDEDELQNAVNSIHSLIVAPINIYDTGNKNIVRPKEEWNTHAFCYTMWKECPAASGKCNACYQNAFRETSRTHETLYFKCHAGLSCIVTPIVKQDTTYGFIVLGEVTDTENREDFIADVRKRCANYDVPEEVFLNRLPEVPYVPTYKLMAAMHLMEMAAQSILFKEAMFFKNDAIAEGLSEYIDQHLQQQIHVQEICRAFHISRTTLYSLCQSAYHTSIAKLIRNRRVEKAKELLRATDKKVYQIASEVGFAQYGTFFSFFRKETGLSPEAYREHYLKTKKE